MSAQQRVRPEGTPSWRRWARIVARRGFRRWCSSLIRLLLAGILTLSPPLAAAQQNRSGEYELKAAFLYNFTRFVEWPTGTYADLQAPTVLCILGQDPFGSALTRAIAGKTSNGRPLLIRRLQPKEATRGCHVLYISSSERKSIPQIFGAVKGSNALTVGETDQFAAHGGVIQLILQDKQVRFEINVDAASQEGLKISSKLLALARIVSGP